jgi:ankyrin repeat protein
VQLLLDSGCDYTRIDRQGCTGRAIAVKNGHMEIANALREWSAHNARDSSGRTARERAIERRGDAWGKLSSEEQLLAVRREEASMAAELAEAESAFFEAADAHRQRGRSR